MGYSDHYCKTEKETDMSTLRINKRGNREWENENGRLHRIDGPAVEYGGGYKAWFKNGKYHRLDGPAVEFIIGERWWFKEGKLHRTDGPAIEGLNENNQWYIDNKEYTEFEFKELLKK